MDMKLSIEKLKKFRESKAWTQSHLAEVADISLRTIQRIEKSGLASPESAKAICSAYGLTVEEILETKNKEVNIESAANYLKNKLFRKNILTPAFIAFIIAFILSFYLGR